MQCPNPAVPEKYCGMSFSYPQEFRHLVWQANAGDAKVCKQVSDIYSKGSSGVPRDPILALKYHNRAAADNQSDQARVSRDIESMTEPEKEESANSLFTTAADAIAAASYYRDGVGEKLQDQTKKNALVDLELAHKLGHREAAWKIYQLGGAKSWLKIAADRGNGEACFQYAISLTNNFCPNEEEKEKLTSPQEDYFFLYENNDECKKTAVECVQKYCSEFLRLCFENNNTNDKNINNKEVLKTIFTRAKKWYEEVGPQDKNQIFYDFTDMLLHPASGVSETEIADVFVIADKNGNKNAARTFFIWYTTRKHANSDIPVNAKQMLLEYAIKHKKIDDLKKNLEMWADAGWAVAQNKLGHLSYTERKTLPFQSDYVTAKKYYELAAKQGCADSQAMLGIMNLKGHGAFKNLTEATKWFTFASNEKNIGKEGYSQAMLQLGLMDLNGEGVTKNPYGAVQKLKLASDDKNVGKAGYMEAILELGKVYLRGADGISPDVQIANEYFLKIKDVSAEANLLLGEIAENQKNIQQALIYYQKNVELHPTHAVKEGPSLQSIIKLMQNPANEAVLRNLKLSVDWYRTLAEVEGNARGKFLMGMMYMKGYLVQQDNKQALHYLMLSYEEELAKNDTYTLPAGAHMAQLTYMLGEISQGQKAIEYYLSTAEYGAQLGQMFVGKRETPNLEASAHAHFKLAKIYLSRWFGEGHDIANAHSHLRSAHYQGAS